MGLRTTPALAFSVPMQDRRYNQRAESSAQQKYNCCKVQSVFLEEKAALALSSLPSHSLTSARRVVLCRPRLDVLFVSLTLKLPAGGGDGVIVSRVIADTIRQSPCEKFGTCSLAGKALGVKSLINCSTYLEECCSATGPRTVAVRDNDASNELLDDY